MMKNIRLLAVFVTVVVFGFVGFSQSVVLPTPKPTPTPTPFQTPTPLPANYIIPTKTLPELQTKIGEILKRPYLQRGSVGVKIVSLDTGKTIFDENSEKYFMPASNMKSFTVATGFAKLSPEFKFITGVYANEIPNKKGVIRGDMIIYGRGDVSMSMAFLFPEATSQTVFSNADYLKAVEPLANKIVASGVKKIDGNLVGDESYFSDEAIPSSWEWDDLQWYYGAEVSALPVLDNAVDLFVKPGSVNSPCKVQMLPLNSQFAVTNRCLTVAEGNKREIRIVKNLNQNVLEISGTMPASDKGFRGYVTVTRPAKLFVEMLRQVLQQKGVTITGQNRTINAKEKSYMTAASTTPLVEIAKLESPAYSVIAAKTMKPSQNMFTETILRTIGEQVGDKTDLKQTSTQRGLVVVQNFLKEVGISGGSVVQWDGSGLSRHNLITPNAAVQLYVYMARHPYSQAWFDSLTIAGIDGTLKFRLLRTKAVNNLRGKTGTIDQVSTLTGYVTTSAGEKLVFSVLINGVPSGSLRNSTIDEIAVLLANFEGKTQ